MNAANAKSFMRGLRGMWSHPDPVSVIDHIDYETAGASMPGYPLTIWQIIRHMYGWCWLNIEWLRPDDNFPDPDTDNYFVQEKAPADEKTWKAAQKEMHEIVDALKEVLPGVNLEKKHENLFGNTSGDLLMVLITHTSYHLSKINTILQINEKLPDSKVMYVEDLAEL